MRLLLLVLASSCLAACHSAGPYGHSRTYSPLSAEESAAQSSTDYDPVMAERMPQKWRGKRVSLFGVVTARDSGDSGSEDLKLSVRTLAPRNLCESADEDSCRVTVSEREHAVVHVMVKLESKDAIGRYSVAPGSLVRVIGEVTDNVDKDGSATIRGAYYRHWPRNFFVTTAAREDMRR